MCHDHYYHSSSLMMTMKHFVIVLVMLSIVLTMPSLLHYYIREMLKKTGKKQSGWPLWGGKGVTPPPAWPLLFVKIIGTGIGKIWSPKKRSQNWSRKFWYRKVSELVWEKNCFEKSRGTSLGILGLETSQSQYFPNWSFQTFCILSFPHIASQSLARISIGGGTFPKI